MINGHIQQWVCPFCVEIDIYRHIF